MGRAIATWDERLPPTAVHLWRTSMRTLLPGAASLCAASLLVAAAHAQEVWQTLPEPPAMPEPAESGMAPVTPTAAATAAARARSSRSVTR